MSNILKLGFKIWGGPIYTKNWRKKSISFSSIFNVEGPFQRYLPKTSWKWQGWVKITPLENSKNIFSQKAPSFWFVWKLFLKLLHIRWLFLETECLGYSFWIEYCSGTISSFRQSTRRRTQPSARPPKTELDRSKNSKNEDKFRNFDKNHHQPVQNDLLHQHQLVLPTFAQTHQFGNFDGSSGGCLSMVQKESFI